MLKSLQSLLTIGAPAVERDPEGIDGDFGSKTKAAVHAFQAWGGVTENGVVGKQTWSVSLHARQVQRWKLQWA